MKRSLFFGLILFTLAVSIFPACGGGETGFSINQMIIFGDDNSDGGQGANGIYTITDGEQPPSPPYFEGRFSNGLLYVNWLFGFMGIPYLPSENNFAVGGATTGEINILLPDAPGMLTQVQNFVAANGQVTDSALFILFAGGNDFLVPGFDPNTGIPQMLDNITEAVSLLAGVGAKFIAISNATSLGPSPLGQSSGQTDTLNQLTFVYNENLAGLVESLKAQFPDITIFLINSFEVQFGAILMPEMFGFTNVTDACLQGETICATPEQFLYWDQIHFSNTLATFLAGQFFQTMCVDPSVFKNCENQELLEGFF